VPVIGSPYEETEVFSCVVSFCVSGESPSKCVSALGGGFVHCLRGEDDARFGVGVCSFGSLTLS
jgi:hypothetical protein